MGRYLYLTNEEVVMNEERRVLREFVLLVLSSTVGGIVSVYVYDLYLKNPEILTHLEVEQVFSIMGKASGYIIVISLALAILYFGAQAMIFILNILMKPVLEPRGWSIHDLSPKKNFKKITELKKMTITVIYQKHPERYNTLLLVITFLVYASTYSPVIAERFPGVHVLIFILFMYSILYYGWEVVKKSEIGKKWLKQ